MYRSYGDYNRGRSHKVRNMLVMIAVVALIVIAGFIFANTAAGKSLLDKLGVPTQQKAAQNTRPSGATRLPVVNPTTARNTPQVSNTPEPTQQASNKQSTSALQPTSAKGSSVPAMATVPGTNTPSPKGASQKDSGKVIATPSVSPLETAQRFLVAWNNGKYRAMYELLASDSRQKYSWSYFNQRYSGITDAATITSVDANLPANAKSQAKQSGGIIRIPFSVKMQTQLVGDIDQSNLMTLVYDNNRWRVEWAPSLIFNQLKEGEHIFMQRYSAPRGNIYDRNGTALAVNGDIPQIGIVPGQLKNPSQAVSKLSHALGLSEKYIKSLYQGKPSGWFIPVKTLSQSEYQKISGQFKDVPGVTFQNKPNGRVYPQGSVLGQVLGYVGPITADDLKNPNYKGYPLDAVIGKVGLEHWGEKYLRGQDGGQLQILSADYKTVDGVIKERAAVPGDDIYLNIDMKLQNAAENDYGNNLVGGVVAMDPRNGEILALVSKPSYNPNDFQTGISSQEVAQINKKQAWINRVTNAAYPMASTFKPITMGAALTSGLFKPTSRFYDPGYWNKLGDTRYEWYRPGFGWLTLNQGLTRSADVVFYNVGYELYQKKYDYLSKYARKWGLGQAPNVDGLINEPGMVPGPGVPTPGWSAGDNVNLSIGQGALEVSPLQDAMVYTAIANGGTLYRPLLINRIVAGGENKKVIKRYAPEVIRKVPISKSNLQQIQNDLKNVTQTEIGTAYSIFKGFPIPVGAKTGTGQKDKQKPFAWFSSYAPADNPRLVVVVMAENAGEGADISAPITKKILGDYFNVSVPSNG